MSFPSRNLVRPDTRNICQRQSSESPYKTGGMKQLHHSYLSATPDFAMGLLVLTLFVATCMSADQQESSVVSARHPTVEKSDMTKELQNRAVESLKRNIADHVEPTGISIEEINVEGGNAKKPEQQHKIVPNMDEGRFKRQAYKNESYTGIWENFEIGIAAHELAHALGFIHTQERHDRDQYITVDKSNIEPAICGEEVNATSNWTLLVTANFSVMTHGSQDGYKKCVYWINAPNGSYVEVKLTKLPEDVAKEGCIYGGVEIKARKDQRLTGYRFCSEKDVNLTLMSNTSTLPVLTYMRRRRNDTAIELEYRIAEKQQELK
ncbi:astacin [Teladorsagia circumcincta]|uniref:Metalloendopeptidase n=1 Tax=Teladorsagia circumcincta TaxID=45464 RepID=A0A2G9UQP8_TELCI|nr:astacin [Teladorsagia circumcincta]